MRKKEILFGILFVFFLIAINFTSAVLTGETEAVQAGYDCLKDTVETKTCNSLSLEEQIFSLLAVGKCKDQVLAKASPGNTCWPVGNCDLRTTALATLALDKINFNVTNSTNWMLAQKGVPTDIDWFLEIDSNEAAACQISSNSRNYLAQINEDKTVSIAQNSCLSVDQLFGGYWFKIDETCYGQEFEISCDQEFLTTLLFKKPSSSTLYVLNKVHSELAGGTTIEKIDSSCFRDGVNCDYEGSLWTSMVLDILNKDVTSIIPYLITGKTENLPLLPSSFLYYLTNGLEFRTELLLKQINEQYWKAGTDKYYDTPLALLSLQGENPQEKENSKQWLIDTQEENGCWNNGNVRDTAFILYSVWPEIGTVTPEFTCLDLGYECVENETSCDGNILGYECSSGVCCDDGTVGELSCMDAGYECVENISSCEGTIVENNCSTGVCCDSYSITLPGEDEEDCIFNGFYCMSSKKCSDSGGNILYDYDCLGFTNNCCDAPETTKTCADFEGEVCYSGEYCTGEPLITYELYGSQKCCVGGTCEPEEITSPNEYTCELNFGICSEYTCIEGEYESSEFTCQDGDLCCMQDETLVNNNTSYWWVWLLFALIILVTLGILYREKIQEFILNMKNKGNDSETKNTRGFPPSYPKRPMMGSPPPRRIFPPTDREHGTNNMAPPQNRNFATRKPAVQKSPQELSEVLKKLKDMSK